MLAEWKVLRAEGQVFRTEDDPEVQKYLAENRGGPLFHTIYFRTEEVAQRFISGGYTRLRSCDMDKRGCEKLTDFPICLQFRFPVIEGHFWEIDPTYIENNPEAILITYTQKDGNVVTKELNGFFGVPEFKHLVPLVKEAIRKMDKKVAADDEN